MEPFPFDATLSVGHARMDSQHRDLMRRFDRLGACRSADFGPNRKVRAMMSDLIIAVTRHFIDEEELMVQSGYPDCEAHIREHADFVEQLSQALETDREVRLRTSIPALAAQMIRHVKTQDLAYRPYLTAEAET